MLVFYCWSLSPHVSAYLAIFRCVPIADTMDIVKKHKKGKYINTLEKCHIQKLYANNLHINYSAIEPNNPIFKILHEIDNR
jgi:hypothetical protein